MEAGAALHCCLCSDPRPFDCQESDTRLESDGALKLIILSLSYHYLMNLNLLICTPPPSARAHSPPAAARMHPCMPPLPRDGL